MAAELLDQFQYKIEGLSLVPSDGGRFEVSVGDDLVYSKLSTHRHPEPGEVARLVAEALSG